MRYGAADHRPHHPELAAQLLGDHEGLKANAVLLKLPDDPGVGNPEALDNLGQRERGVPARARQGPRRCCPVCVNLVNRRRRVVEDWALDPDDGVSNVTRDRRDTNVLSPPRKENLTRAKLSVHRHGPGDGGGREHQRGDADAARDERRLSSAEGPAPCARFQDKDIRKAGPRAAHLRAAVDEQPHVDRPSAGRPLPVHELSAAG